jgi:protein required for attachment to host cells
MRHDYLVVVADGTCARFFTLEPATLPELESGPRLVEHDDLVNTEHRLHGRDKYSATRTGSRVNPGGGSTHGVDDHRDKQEQEHERRFAADVTARAVELALASRAGRLVLAAEDQMLGLLRDTLKLPAKPELEVHELAKDLVKLSPTELQEHLAAAGVLPGMRAGHAP